MLLVSKTIRLDGDCLVFGNAYSEADGWRRRPNERLLTEFCDLAHLPKASFAAAALRYAREYGPLSLCEHGEPTCYQHRHEGDESEHERRRAGGVAVRRSTAAPAHYCIPSHREHLDHWRAWAELFAAYRDLIYAVTAGRTGTTEQWQDIHPSLADRVEAPHDRQSALSVLSYELDELLKMANLRLCSIVEHGRLGLSYAPTGVGTLWLFPNLVNQLVSMALHGRRVLNCSRCGRPYVPRRLPSTGTARCCGRLACKRGAARIASQNYRDRKQRRD